MKKVILSLLVVGFAVAFSSCGKKEAKPAETPV
jgi:predicted small lipoprotein YifL